MADAQGLWGGAGGPGSYLDLQNSNPAMRDALLAFGASMLQNRRKGTLGTALGAGLQSGANTWATRQPYYKQQAEQDQQKEMVAAIMRGEDPWAKSAGGTAAADGAPRPPVDLSGAPGAPTIGASGVAGATPPVAGAPTPTPGAGQQQPQQPPPQPGPTPGAPVPGNLAANRWGSPYQVASTAPFAAGGAAPQGAPFGGATTPGPTPAWDRLPSATASKMRSIALAVGMSEDQANAWTRQILQESGGNHFNADGTIKRGTSGEYGVGQIMPKTFAGAQKKYGVQGDIQNEDTNLEVSARIAKEGFDRYGVTPAGSTYYNSPRAAAAGEWTQYTDAVWGKNPRGGAAGAAQSKWGPTRQTADVSGQVGAPSEEQQAAVPTAGAVTDLSGRRAPGAAGAQQQTAAGLLNEPGGGLSALQDPDFRKQLGMIYAIGGLPAAQQAIMSVLSDKPEIVGNKEAGYYLRRGGRMQKISEGTGPEHWVDEDNPDLPAGIRQQRSSVSQEVRQVGTARKAEIPISAEKLRILHPEGDFDDNHEYTYDPYSENVTVKKGEETLQVLMTPEDKAARVPPEVLKAHPDWGFQWGPQTGLHAVTGGGTTVNIDQKKQSVASEEALKGIYKQRDAIETQLSAVYSQSGLMQRALNNALAPGGTVVGGTWDEWTLGARKTLAQLHFPGIDPDKVSSDEYFKSASDALARSMKQEGEGTMSNYDVQMMQKMVMSLGKTNAGNYIIGHAMDVMTHRKSMLLDLKEKYLNSKDPETGEVRNSTAGFQEWLNSPDPKTGVVPGAKLPKLFYDFHPGGLDYDMTKPGSDPAALASLPRGTVFLGKDNEFHIWPGVPQSGGTP